MQDARIADNDIAFADVVALFIDNVYTGAAAHIQQFQEIVVLVQDARMNGI